MRIRVCEIVNEAVCSGTVVRALFIAMDKDGALLADSAAGLRALGGPELMGDATYFPLAMQLVHRRVLTLDEPIDGVMRVLPTHACADDRSNPELRPGTLNLLTNAGFATKLVAFLAVRDGHERPNAPSGDIRI
ncbi:hypothetical protein AURDEDRAFT_172467 [Auricularia subglabra TFB-10046 SS5]|nr:hypothetical protein AURDEDRAFT_172467 [Auricularia subglabra TFB-10046 SS5]